VALKRVSAATTFPAITYFQPTITGALQKLSRLRAAMGAGFCSELVLIQW
jgi:hypothetical protein